MTVKSGAGMAVLDFSGTLSLGAVHFARPQKLKRALRNAGLADLGLDPEAFWNEVINPSWREGSTTALGYRRLLCDRVRRLAAARGRDPDLEKISAAAARFTADYLTHSAIAPEWAPVLRRLARRGAVIVATDHYAEATAHIVRQLAGLGLEAVPARRGQAWPGRFLVANSADLGAHKETGAFWAALRRYAGPDAVSAVAVVDDFGFNEQPADSYAAKEKVAARRARTAAAIEAAWHVPVKVFPFLLQRAADFPALVAAAEQFLRQELQRTV